jgi:carbohydrate-selective porin OprB
MNLDEVNGKIDVISSLKKNWNGYGAKAFSQNVIDRAKMITQLLFSEVEVFPTGRGTIQFEWELDDNNYLEIEVYDYHTVSWAEINGKSDKEDY